MVQGWKENDKWQRRQFKDEEKAKSFAAIKQVAMENEGRDQRMAGREAELINPKTRIIIIPLNKKALEPRAFQEIQGSGA